MDRRQFLHTLAATTAALSDLPAFEQETKQPTSALRGTTRAEEVPVNAYTLICTFSRGGKTWTVYEDLRTRDSVIVFVSSSGEARVLRKTAEATFAEDDPQ